MHPFLGTLLLCRAAQADSTLLSFLPACPVLNPKFLPGIALNTTPPYLPACATKP